MTQATQNSVPTRNLDIIQPPTAGESLSVYLAYLKTLKADSLSWDRGKGRMSWLQGTVLLHARKACQESGVDGAWGKFLGSVGVKETTAKYLRKIAVTISEEESHTLGYDEMLARCYPSYSKAVKAEVDAESGTTTKRTCKTNSSPVKGGVPVDDATVAAWTVKKLTVAVKSVQETATQVTGRDIPDDFDENRCDYLRTLIAQAETELARIRQTVESWQTTLNPSRRAA